MIEGRPAQQQFSFRRRSVARAPLLLLARAIPGVLFFERVIQLIQGSLSAKLFSRHWKYPSKSPYIQPWRPETAAFQRRRITNAAQAQRHLCYLRSAATAAGVRKFLSRRFTSTNRIQRPRESTTSLTPAESHSAGFDVLVLWSSDPAT
jgi:hypothetical protein